MRRLSPYIRVLVLLLIAGIFGTSACVPEMANVEIVQEPVPAQAIPDWIQVNENGFGDPRTGEVTALDTFNGYLYAGTFNPIDPAPGTLFDGAQIFRSADGVTWNAVTQPGFGNSHDTAPPAILDFVVFNSRLYAGTGRGNASQIWRSLNGTTWAPMDVTGFSDPDNVDITAFAVYNGMIYAGVANRVTGAQIWRSFTGDNNSWTRIAPDVPGTVVSSVSGFAEFDGGLYAAVESEFPAQIWRSFGGTWEIIVNNGFGDSNTRLTGGLAVFGGDLYVGAGSTANGAQVWRTMDGLTWEQVIMPGFGDPNNRQVEAIFVFQNQLYAGVENQVTGLEIWRTADGSLWEQVNQDGFGDSNNITTNGSNAITDFMSKLYVGTRNIVGGGELWQMTEQSVATPIPTDTLTITSTGTSTNTPSFTPTNTPTHTPSFTPTHTPTDTPSFTPTNTSVNTPTYTATFTATHTATDTPTNTPPDNATYTPTYTPTNTLESTPTFTITDTPTSTLTITPTNTPSQTPTQLSSTPGKVTGGGVIGADKGGNKVTFGFVINFSEGDTEPKGNLIYQDHRNNLRLKARSFDLLVVEGNQAWFTGIGVLDDGREVDFKVELTTGDKPEQPAIFRIYIPALNGYESGGALTGGNITIH